MCAILLIYCGVSLFGKSSTIVKILSPLGWRRVSNFCLYHGNTVNGLFLFERIQKLPKLRMVAVTNALKCTVPTLNVVVCTWHLLLRTMEHVPHLDGKQWSSSGYISSVSPNISILEIIEDLIRFFSVNFTYLIAKSFKYTMT